MHKINKKMADFEGQEASVSADLEIHDPGENHNKFWRIRVYGSIVVRHWGRHGAKGQQMAEEHGSEWAAKSAARDLRDDKINKGYKTEVGVLDRFAREM